MNLTRLLESAVSRPDSGLRLLDRREEATWASWGSIHRASRTVGARLVALGLAPGERVALIYPTGLDFFHAFFGILHAGGVPVPLYPPVRLGRLDEYHRRTAAMLKAAGTRLVMTETRIKRLLGPTVATARPYLGCCTLDDLPTVEKSAVAELTASVEMGPDDLALVQFSSGTTVAPKPVALSHRAILAQARILNSFWPETSELEGEGLRHSGVSWLPLYHDMGLIGCIFPAIGLKTVLTLIGPEVFVARPAVWLRALSRYQATVSPAPNFAYGLCVEKIRDEELEGVDLSNWRVALNGAEPVAPAVLRRFQERFAPWGFRPEALTPVYGLSEASLAVTFSALHEPFTTTRFDREALAEDRVVPLAEDLEGSQELPSLGPPLPEFDLRIADREGRTAPPDRVGRVLVKGPSLMDGYLDQPEATARAFIDGWLDTGDLGFLHQGELYLTGRAKDVVILRGRNHPPHDIEQAVGEVEGLRKGCVVAVSHLEEEADTESLYLFVEHSREASDEEIADLTRACRAAVLAVTGLRVDRVLILAPGTLPRTSSGKLRRGETLKLHLRGELKPPKRVGLLTLGGALAKSALAYAGMRHQSRG